MSDPVGSTFKEQATLPFGTSIDSETSGVSGSGSSGTGAPSNQRFTSYDRSEDTGLDYAVNRTYNSGQSGFTKVDPIGMASASIGDPQSLNLFAYVTNNPVDFVDPSGLIGRQIYCRLDETGYAKCDLPDDAQQMFEEHSDEFNQCALFGSGCPAEGGGDDGVVEKVRKDLAFFLSRSLGCSNFLTDYASKLFSGLHPDMALIFFVFGLRIMDSTTSNPKIFSMTLDDIGAVGKELVTLENYEIQNEGVSGRGVNGTIFIYDDYFKDQGHSKTRVRGTTVFHEVVHALFGSHEEIARAFTDWTYPIPSVPYDFAPFSLDREKRWEQKYREEHKADINFSAFIAMEEWIEGGC